MTVLTPPSGAGKRRIPLRPAPGALQGHHGLCKGAPGSSVGDATEAGSGAAWDRETRKQPRGTGGRRSNEKRSSGAATFAT